MTNYMDIDFSTFEEMTTALHKMAVGTEMAWLDSVSYTHLTLPTT